MRYFEQPGYWAGLAQPGCPPHSQLATATCVAEFVRPDGMLKLEAVGAVGSSPEASLTKVLLAV